MNLYIKMTNCKHKAQIFIEKNCNVPNDAHWGHCRLDLMSKEIHSHDYLGLNGLKKRLPKCQGKLRNHVVHSIYNLTIMSYFKLSYCLVE